MPEKELHGHPRLVNLLSRLDLKPKSDAGSGRRTAIFHKEFRQDLAFWVKADRRTAVRILKLVEDTLRNPSHGLGKPEPLKYLGEGLWSRRITQEHRLVYLVQGPRVEFLQARYHY